jgi:hypothetical protein
MLRLSRLIVFGLTLWSATAEATTYYVSTSGSDSANGTSISTPFRTIGKAASVVNPGDVVNVRGGTYGENVFLTRSGTAGNPVTFQAYPGELPILDGRLAAPGSGFDVTACNIILDGFEIAFYTNASDGGEHDPIFLHACSSNASTTIVRNNHPHHFTSDQPSSITIIGYAGSIEIANNIMHDNCCSANNQNDTGLNLFQDTLAANAVSILWAHNNLAYNVIDGLRWKHQAPLTATVSAIFEKNLCHDLRGSGSACVFSEQQGTIIRNNIVYNSTCAGCDAFRMYKVGGAGTCVNCSVYNNTAYNVLEGILNDNGATGTNVHDNIVQTTTGAGLDINVTTGFSSDYDFFAGAAVNCPGLINFSCQTLALLQAFGWESHGRTGNPLFVNPTGNPPDFHLQAGSPAKGAGTGGRDMGAYPTGTEVIGPTAGGGGGDTSPPPSAPSNLKVQ